jgi:RNA polymerase sigma-70 factor, ECF subfamily
MSGSAAIVSSSDEELAGRAQHGCLASFEQLLRRYQTPVLHFLRHRGLAADAEDVAQEVFLRAYRNLHRYDRRWAFSAWLFTITRRLSLNHRRRERLDRGASTTTEIIETNPGPLDVLIAAEGRKHLWDTISAMLTEEQTTALWLYYVEEMPIRGISLALGRSPASVKILLFRARRKLAPLLKESDDRGWRLPVGTAREASCET